MGRAFLLSIAIFLGGCALSARTSTKPPINIKPPTGNTSSLGDNIKDLEKNLTQAASRAERIRILLESNNSFQPVK